MKQKDFDEIYDDAHKLALHLARKQAIEEARKDISEIECLVIKELYCQDK